MSIRSRIFKFLIISFLLVSTARGQFLQTGAGPYDYNVTSNWTDSVINGVFSQTLTANQTVGFSTDTTLTTALTFANGGAFNEALIGLGGTHTITLGGNISVDSMPGGQTVTFGSLTSGQTLNVNSPQNTLLTFSVGAMDTLVFLNSVQAASSVYKDGLGTLIFGGSSVCPINLLENGTLILDCSAQAGSKLISGANLGLRYCTFKLLGNSSAPTTQNFMTLYLQNPGAANVSVVSNGQSTILNTGDFTRNGTIGATVDFTLPLNGAIETSAGNSNGILGGFATVGKTTWATNDGSGNIVGLTSYVNTISTGSNTDLISNSTVSTNTSESTLRFNTASPITATIANGVALTTGGILVTSNVGSNLSLITGGTLASSSPDLVIHQYNQSAALEIDSLINTSFGLTVSGPGTLILRGANTYGYATTINGATLNILADNNLGSSFENQLYINGGSLQLAGNLTLDRSISAGDAGATIDTHGFNYTFPGQYGFEGTGSLTKTGNGTLFLYSYATFSGPITISGGTLAVEARSNTAILQGTNPIVFTGGTLQFDGDTTDYSSRVINSSSAVSIDTAGSNITFASNLASSNTGGLVKLGAGRLTLAGLNNYTGSTLLSGGTLQFAKEASLYNGSVTSWNATNIVISSGATFALNVGGNGEFTAGDIGILLGLATLNGGFQSGALIGLDTTNAGGGNFIYAAVIANTNGGSNTLGLAKLGTNTLTLTGDNSFTGMTNINGGDLNLGFGRALGGGGNITFSGGTLQYSASNSNDYSSRIINSTSPISIDTNGQNVTFATALGNSNTGGLTKAGSGTLTISGASSYTGPTNVTGGVLIIAGNLTSSSLISVASGATLNFASGGLATSGTITNNGTLVLGNGVSVSSTGVFTNNGTLDLRNDPSFTLPDNFVNNGTVLSASTTLATDTPTMPMWALVHRLPASLLCWSKPHGKASTARMTAAY